MLRLAVWMRLPCATSAVVLSVLALLPQHARANEQPLRIGVSVVARVPLGRSVTLYAKPRGAAVLDLGDRTEFGSRMTMTVVRRRGRWLAVISSRLADDRLGWIKRDVVDLRRIPISLTVDLSARSLLVQRGRKIIARVTVGIGGTSSPTPRGIFSITDKLVGQRYDASYGCCILALSGHQSNLPLGWRGGNRIAIHGTDAPRSIGAAVSGGCLRASERDMRTLMRIVPLGTAVTIRR
jgi:hypothetical protein